MASHHLRGRNLFDSHDCIPLHTALLFRVGPFEVSRGHILEWGVGAEDGVHELRHGFPRCGAGLHLRLDRIPFAFLECLFHGLSLRGVWREGEEAGEVGEALEREGNGIGFLFGD